MRSSRRAPDRIGPSQREESRGRGRGRERGGVPALVARALVVASVLSALLYAPPLSGAEESPTVLLGPAGPDRRLPLGKVFFLQGSSLGAERVNVVFVRTSFGPFGLGRAPRCEDVLAAAGPLRRGVFVQEALAAGPTGGYNVWTNDAAADHPVLVAGGWSRPAAPADGSTFVVRVPDEPSFFRPGADYCLFVYTTERPAFDGTPLLAAADELRERLSGCAEDACETAALSAFQARASGFVEASRKREWETCPGSVEKVEPCPTALDRELSSITQDLTTAAFLGASSKRRSIQRAITAWPALYRQSPVSVAPAAEGARTPVAGTLAAKSAVAGAKDGPSVPQTSVPATSALGQLLLGLLSRYHEVRSAPTGTGLRYFTADGSVEIAYLQIGEALRSFEVTSGLAPSARRAVLGTDTSKVLLPDSTASLLDVLELARGRVWTGSRFERPEEAYSTADAARLSDLKGRLSTLRDVLRAGDRATKPGASQSGSPALSGANVYAALGLWWRELTTTDCAAWAKIAGAAESDHCTKSRDGASSALTALESPLEVLIARLGNYLEAESAMGKARARVSALRGAARVRPTATVSARASFSMNAGITQHVTPSVGVALATRPAEAIPVVYGGIKIYPWPNPVDEPMWSNGRIDLRRMFALEVALGTTPRDIGEDGRFSGPGGGAFPPVLIGAAFQLLPYSTFSMGAILLEARRSTLGQEATRPYPSFYVGASIDANVFDAIAAVLTAGRRSSTDLLVK